MIPNPGLVAMRARPLALVIGMALLATTVHAQSSDSLVVRIDIPGKEATRSFDLAALRALPRVDVSIDDHGEKRQCSGIEIADVLEPMGITMDRVRGDLVSYYVLVSARDDYRAVFSLSELASDLVSEPVLLAFECNGEPLPESHGPLRVIAPGDTRPTRWVRQVSTLTVRHAQP